MQPAKNAMSEALKRKKARGLDMAILIGGAEPDDAEDQKELGLAPGGTVLGENHTAEDIEMGKATHDAGLLKPGAEMMQDEIEEGEKGLDEKMGKGDGPQDGNVPAEKSKETVSEAKKEDNEKGQSEPSSKHSMSKMGQMLAERMGRGSLARKAMTKAAMKK
jgi:hypothetical protein